jgi:hypothetical protein
VVVGRAELPRIAGPGPARCPVPCGVPGREPHIIGAIDGGGGETGGYLHIRWPADVSALAQNARQPGLDAA